jgi:hypothetical protein
VKEKRRTSDAAFRLSHPAIHTQKNCPENVRKPDSFAHYSQFTVPWTPEAAGDGGLGEKWFMYLTVLRTLEEASDDEVRRLYRWPAETDMKAARPAAHADVCKKLEALAEAGRILAEVGLL